MTRIRILPERWRYSIGIIRETFLACGLAVCLADESPKHIEISPSAELGELKAENRRLKKEVERLEESTEKRLYRQDNTRSISDDSSGHNSNRSDPGTGNIPESINVEATFYSAFCSTGCSGITATGLDVSSTIYTPDGLRVIAVDPNVIALGSTVKVTLANGDSFTAKASDTGGDIKGARIDVLVRDETTAYKLGRQAAKVEVISE